MNATKTTMPFGKHKGTRISEVPRQYLEWFLREISGCGEEKQAIREFLGMPHAEAQSLGPMQVKYQGDRLRFITGNVDGLPPWPAGFSDQEHCERGGEPPFDVDRDEISEEFRAMFGA